METKYITIKGKKVEVTEEVYRAYVRPIRAEQRRKRLEWRCGVKGKNGKLVRCMKKCSECKYALAGGKPTGTILSLDTVLENGGDVPEVVDLKEKFGLKTKVGIITLGQIHKAIEQLSEKQRQVIEMIYFHNKTQAEIAEFLGITQSSVSKLLSRGLQEIKSFLEKN